MYCHIHHCHYHHCHCVPKDSKEKGGALTQEELLTLTEEMKDELKDFTVDLKDQIFSYIDIGVNPVEIANTFASLKEQDNYILRTLTSKIDDLNNTSNLSMYNLRTRVTSLEGQSATLIQDLTDRTQRIEVLETNTIVVESVAELSTIENPIDGLRVYVKSYHAGLGKGGGYFTYDSSKATVNNTGTVINGWVRETHNGLLFITMFGAKSDGETDDTQAFKTAVQYSGNKAIVVPAGTTCISDTIVLGRGVSVVGEGNALSSHAAYNKSRIVWIGTDSPRKTMIQLGANKVGAEPTTDATAVTVKDINLAGAGKVGFLIYGTYLTNDTLIQNVYGNGSTEYNFYFARGWYLTINRLISGNCKHNGIALGMPLVYSDGERVAWSSASPLEINNSTLFDIRSLGAGSMYSVDAPNTWKPTTQYLIHGYGIGAGVGNGFRLSNFLSEKSGGVNLYSYNQSQPSKTIENGYLENACVNSGLNPASDLVNMYLDYGNGNRANGGGHVIRDVFMNYHSGGIAADGDSGGFGSNWSVKLENIHQPRFLKHIDSLSGGSVPIWDSRNAIYWVIPLNCYYDLRHANLPTTGAILVDMRDVNTRYTWSSEIPSTLYTKFLLIRSNEPSDKYPVGSIWLELSDGSTQNIKFPTTEFSRGKWVVINTIPSNTVKISKGGASPDINSLIDIRVVEGSPALKINT